MSKINPHDVSKKDAAAPQPWAPVGQGADTVKVANKSNKPETLTLTGNDRSKKSITVPPNEVLPVELPNNWAGNISASLDGSNSNANKTLFEVHTGSGQGTPTAWDVSDITGNNMPMHATAPGTSDVGDSLSNAPGAHYNAAHDDTQRPSPMKTTTGTEMDVSIG